MGTLALFAASMLSLSRMLPPGCTIATTPPYTYIVSKQYILKTKHNKESKRKQKKTKGGEEGRHTSTDNSTLSGKGMKASDAKTEPFAFSPAIFSDRWMLCNLYIYISHCTKQQNKKTNKKTNKKNMTLVGIEPGSPLPDETFQDTPLTSHLSPLTSHLSPLTSHLSPLTSHLSPLTSHLSPLTSHLSPLTSHLSPLTSHLSPLTLPRGTCPFASIRFQLRQVSLFSTSRLPSSLSPLLSLLLSTLTC